MWVSRSVNCSASTQVRAARTDMAVKAGRFRPATVTARASGFRRAPWHCAQARAVMYFSISSRAQSDSVSA